MVRDGYKQTEVGEIPEDWDVDNVGNAFEICNTLRFPISTKQRESIQGPYPYYGPTRIQDYLNEYRVDGEYALIGEDGDHFLKFDSVDQTQLATGKFNVNNHAHLIKGTKNTTKWFYYFFRNRDITKHLSRQGAGRFKLNKATLKQLPCVIPSPAEQARISDVIYDIDTSIVSLEKLIAKKRDIKTATMQQLLTGKKRLPGFGEGKGYKQTELGEIPEDWDIKKVKDFTDGTAGGTPSTQVSSYWGGDILWMSSGELHLKRVHDVEGRISQLGLNNSSTRLIPTGCVLIGLAGQGKTRGTVAINKVELCTNQSIAAIFPSEAHSTEYLFYNLDSRYDELRSLSTGDGGRGGLNLTILRNIELPFPDKTEQLEIARVLADIDKEITVIVERLNKTKSIKQGMMQELLTGRTRLVDVNSIERIEEERMHGT